MDEGSSRPPGRQADAAGTGYQQAECHALVPSSSSSAPPIRCMGMYIATAARRHERGQARTQSRVANMTRSEGRRLRQRMYLEE